MLILLSQLTQLGIAGGWNSMGGKSVSDLHNPWFFQNTSQASYCFLEDPQFGPNIDVVREKFELALKYWKLNFKTNEEYEFRLASQNFVEESCDEDTLLTIQLGYLTEKQREFMGDPTNYVGLTVRTDYDKVNMRGKGFMYIAPENGPLKITRDAIDRYWSKDNAKRLELLFIHELGHIFGVRIHTDGVMSEWFSLLLISKAEEIDVSRFQVPLMFNKTYRFNVERVTNDGFNRNGMKFFNLPYEENSPVFFFPYEIEILRTGSEKGYEESGYGYQVQIFSVNIDGKFAGELRVREAMNGVGSIQSINEIEVVFPDQQAVFEVNSTWPTHSIYSVSAMTLAGHFQPVSGDKQPVLVEWDGFSFRLHGVSPNAGTSGRERAMQVDIIESSYWSGRVSSMPIEMNPLGF